jgi:hypothetical protein
MKGLLQSKTFWFGFLQVVLGVYALITGQMDSQAAFSLIVTGFGTIGLRLKTTMPVAGLVR